MSDINNISLDLYNKNTLYIKRQNLKSDTSQVKAQNKDLSTKEVSIKSTSLSPVQVKESVAEVSIKSQDGARETYGLNILELMSDKEYSAWIKATLNLNDGEKLLAAQKLYQLADMNKLREKSQLDRPKENHDKASLSLDSKTSSENEDPFIINANKLNGIKMFNAHSDFIQRYVNAYSNLEQNININS
ncbi:hypothetical protein [Helicobacter sp. 11S02629-2]|uniref:hypothetical protein n=1 Tax=Helicobacter sp. 11S02629-2 TaxID=1476195 RepID=UPI000BA6204F|nr:hypothetical protein [Helicobacter sp. 11S02629-2]PAF42393.1 hypothetical protein BKH40_07945 [Helicobacter sp. 11S02629-2]